MKRFIGLLLSLVLCMTCIASAMAVSFSFNSDTTTFSRWSNDTTSKGTTWKFSEWTSSNLSDSCQAAVKIYHAPGVYASHTYYYKSKSTAAHNYLDGTAVLAGWPENGYAQRQNYTLPAHIFSEAPPEDNPAPYPSDPVPGPLPC